MSAGHGELRKNIKAFREAEAQLIRDHWGKYALMSDGKVVHFFNSKEDALMVGEPCIHQANSRSRPKSAGNPEAWGALLFTSPLCPWADAVPSFLGQVVNRQILLTVHVAQPGVVDPDGKQVLSATALLDTGATISGISERVVEELGLAKSHEWETIVGVHGQMDVPLYERAPLRN